MLSRYNKPYRHPTDFKTPHLVMQNSIQTKKVTPVKLFLPLHELLDSEGSNYGGGGSSGKPIQNKI
jgi:hypothetical protein